MAITVEEALRLERGQTLYHAIRRNADGTPERWRVNGKPLKWVKHPKRVYVPLKHGLRDHGYLTNDDLPLFCLTEEEARSYNEVRLDAHFVSIVRDVLIEAWGEIGGDIPQDIDMRGDVHKRWLVNMEVVLDTNRLAAMARDSNPDGWRALHLLEVESLIDFASRKFGYSKVLEFLAEQIRLD